MATCLGLPAGTNRYRGIVKPGLGPRGSTRKAIPTLSRQLITGAAASGRRSSGTSPPALRLSDLDLTFGPGVPPSPECLGSAEEAKFQNKSLDGPFALFLLAVTHGSADLGPCVELVQITEDAFSPMS